MVFRSAYDPIFVGLGAAAILATGAVTSVAASTDPGPSSSTSAGASADPAPSPDPPPPPNLYVSVAAQSKKLYPGDSTKTAVHVFATGRVASEVLLTISDSSSKVTVSPACVVYNKACRLQDVDKKGKTVWLNVAVAKKAKPGNVLITATVTDAADGAEPEATDQTLTISKKPPVKAPATPKPKPTPTPKPSNTPSSGGNGSGSGGSGTSPQNNGAGTATGGNSVLPPLPSSNAQAPSVALPPVAQPPVAQPSIAPSPVAAPSSTLRAGTSPAASELSFERLAGTQAAWLAALLAAFSLLLTQVRINRIAMGYRRPKGDHRRSRKGMFGA